MIFRIGETYPPKGDVERLTRYRLMDGLYLGDRATWRGLRDYLQGGSDKVNISYASDVEYGRHFDDKFRQDDLHIKEAKETYIVYNLVRLITDLFSQLGFTRPMRQREIPDNEEAAYAIRRLISDNKLKNFFKQVFKISFVTGDCYAKLRIGSKPEYRNARSEVMFDCIPPEYVFPEFQPGTNWRMEACNIAQKRTIGNNTYLLNERHVPGQIQYQIYWIDGGVIRKEIDFGQQDLWNALWPGIESPTQDTLVDRLLVWAVSWDKYKNGFGESEFYDDLDLFEEVNRKLSGLSHMHEVCTSPILRIPESLMSGQQAKGGYYEMPIKDIIPISPGVPGTDIGWVEITGSGPNLTLEYIHAIIDYIFAITQAPRSFIKTTKEGVQTSESGVAIEKKAASTTLQGLEAISTIREVAEEMLYYAQLLEINHQLEIEMIPEPKISVHNALQDNGSIEGIDTTEEKQAGVDLKAAAYSAASPELEFQWGLIPDIQQRVQDAIAKIQAGLITRQDAILEANPDIDPAEVQGYLDAVDQDIAQTPVGQATGALRESLLRSQQEGESNPLDEFL